MPAISHVSRALVVAFVLATTSATFAADGGDWTVSKSSGEVWLARLGRAAGILEAGRRP